MVKRSKAFISLLISVCATLIASISISLAWFQTATNIIDWQDISGQVLTQYFDRRSYNVDESANPGTENNPFVITTPKHYENLVKLHHKVEGFASADYRFEIGKQFTEGGAFEVYEYNNHGAATGNKCTNLNLGGMKLEPLGNDKYPFSSIIQGNDMTVSNFIVTLSADTENTYYDMGIFGYVAPEGECHNVYYDNFKIDVTGFNAAYTSGPSGSAHNDSPHDAQGYAGYLAGHLTNADHFTNVYVNRCSLLGRTNSSGVLTNNWGYYGYVENDALGATMGTGGNYSFTLNAQACYNYFNNNYEDIQNDGLVLRNTKETADIAPDENGDRIKRLERATVNQAVEYDDGLFPTYNLQGGLSQPTGTNRNYSLSTMGYVAPHFIDEIHNYHVYYKDGSRYINPPSNTVVTTLPMEENPIGGADDEEQNYFYLDTDDASPSDGYDGTWEYYYNRNRAIDPDSDTFKHTFSFTVPNYKPTGETVGAYQNMSCTGYLYIDDREPITFNIAVKRVNQKILFIDNYHIEFTPSNVVVNDLEYGVHNISVKVDFKYDRNLQSNDHAYFYYGTLNGSTINQETFTYRTANQSTKLDTTARAKNNYSMSTIEYDSEETVYFDERSQRYELWAKEIDENGNEIGPYVQLHQKRTSYTYESPKWSATEIKRIQDGSLDLNHFVAEEPELVNSGYSAKNIDVVGDCDFYYHSFKIFGYELFNVKVIAIPSESSGNRLVKKPTASQINNKEHFYATHFAPDSVVLFLKNTSNALDSRDDPLGNIDFTYVDLNILGVTIDFVDPVFKKGNGSYLALDSLPNAEKDDSNVLTSTVHVDLKESDVKKACYCALDSEGRIIGTFSNTGSPETFSGSLSDIATYVLVIGGNSDNDYKAWVTNVDFEYKAEVGYGGVFGSVGYRDYPDRIENTILNYYISLPSGSADFCVIVTYTRRDEENGSYAITVQTNIALFISLHLYDTTHYTVSLNGVDATAAFYSTTIASTGYVYSPPA